MAISKLAQAKRPDAESQEREGSEWPEKKAAHASSFRTCGHRVLVTSLSHKSFQVTV